MRPELQSILAELCPDPSILPPDHPAFDPQVDFETYYDNECSVEPLGNYAYTQHPKFDAYLVSIYAIDIQFVGHPKDAPWDKINGRRWTAHNRNFDKHVFQRLQELGVIPPFIKPKIWHDTADLAAYSHLPRNLAGATRQAFKYAPDKSARSDMKGKRWRDLSDEEKQRMIDYAHDDPILGWALWVKYSPTWPQHEVDLSIHTGEIEFRGIPVDREAIERDISILKTAKHVTEQKIPWLNEEDEKGKPYALRSPRAIKIECIKCGVPPPTTTALKSKDFLEWLDEYGEKVPAIMDLSRYRRIDRALGVYEHLLRRIRPDGRAALGLKYFGADKTGRWSGTAKFNLQNLIKIPLFFDDAFGWLDPVDGKAPANAAHSVDIRARITASPGNKLIIADLSQIEPRVLNWVVGNKDFLAYCASGMSPYEAHARASMGWTEGNLKKESPKVYALAKARVLALGYQAGWNKFIEMARGYLGSEKEFVDIFGAEPPEGAAEEFLKYLEWCREKGLGGAATHLRTWAELDQVTRNIWVNSWVQVTEFRKSNDLIAHREYGLWKRLDGDFKDSFNDGVFENELPSGRSLMYFDVSPAYGWSARQNHPEARPTRVYGGKLTENLVQAIARDLFGLGILALERAGYRVLFHVHDEVIVDAPADADPAHVVALLTQRPDWAKSLPIAAEAEVSTHYKK